MRLVCLFMYNEAVRVLHSSITFKSRKKGNCISYSYC